MTNEQPKTSTIASDGLTAEISMRGAELVRLQDADGRDLLWNGDPAFWTGRAPVLFPIVGRLKDDRATVDGVGYAMRQHGFARTSTFDLVAHEASACRLQLRSSDATRAAYPFDFTLDLGYRLTGPTLDISAAVRNSGSRPMPVAFGFHTAFRWPLPYGADRAAHLIRFEEDEPGPISPLNGGLLSGAAGPSPVVGRVLALDDALFQNDALVFLRPASRSVDYGAPGGPQLRVDFAGMPQLGLWTKPGAGFICIEPWHGYASPADFEGELADKPGMLSIAPGDVHVFAMRVTLKDRRPPAA